MSRVKDQGQSLEVCTHYWAIKRRGIHEGDWKGKDRNKKKVEQRFHKYPLDRALWSSLVVLSDKFQCNEQGRSQIVACCAVNGKSERVEVVSA